MSLFIQIVSFAILAQSSRPDATPPKPLVEARSIDPRFDAIMTASQEVMRNAKTYRVAVEMTTKTTVTGEPEHTTVVSHTIAVRRPDAVAIDSDLRNEEGVKTPVLRVGCDGHSLVTFYAQEPQVYSRYDGPIPTSRLARTLIIPKVLEGSGLEILTRPDMRDYVLREASEAKYLDDEVVDGITTEHFRVRWHGAVLELWIGPKEQPLERKMTSTRVTPLGDGKSSTVIREAGYTWTIDQPIPDPTFQVALPDTAKRVEDVYEALFYQDSAELVGQPAPKTALKQLDGPEVDLAALKGKPVILVFWAGWARDSLEVLSPLADLEAKCKEQGVALFTVCVGSEPSAVRKVVESSRIRLPVLLDPRDLTAVAFGIRRLPTTVAIGPDGRVRAITRESKELSAVREALEATPAK